MVSQEGGPTLDLFCNPQPFGCARGIAGRTKMQHRSFARVGRLSMAVGSHQGRPDFLNHYWARGTGKTWKVLSQFPNRLEEVAEEIERINRADHHFYARQRGNDLTRFELLRLVRSGLATSILQLVRSEPWSLLKRDTLKLILRSVIRVQCLRCRAMNSK
jgi:hypothetical protein